MHERLLGAAPPLLALMLAGCGPDYDTICQERVDCLGGNEADVEACVRQAELQGEIADIEGCDDEWAEYVACLEQNASCESQSTGMACASNDECQGDGLTCGNNGECVYKVYGLEDQEDCEVESRAYGRCEE
jgi:hypothetical protein